jgi:hypothetical protein
VARLREAGDVFHTPDTAREYSKLWATRTDPADFGVPREDVYAYTLRETVFLESCCDRSDFPFARLCGRPIKLTESEISWLRDNLPDRIARECERLGLWTTAEALHALLANDSPHAPPFISKNRKAEIEAALQRPVWAERWPVWTAG